MTQNGRGFKDVTDAHFCYLTVRHGNHQILSPVKVDPVEVDPVEEDPVEVDPVEVDPVEVGSR